MADNHERFRSALELALRQVGGAIINDFLDEREYLLEEVDRLKFELEMQYQRNDVLSRILEAHREARHQMKGPRTVQ